MDHDLNDEFDGQGRRLTMPLVSIITPSYNQAVYLEGTIRSVLSQAYSRIEYIVVDGGSTDGSQEIIKKYEDQISRWVSEEDAGQSSAINKGFRWANGEILAWLNSDDLYTAGTIHSAVKWLQQTPEAGMVYGNGILIDSADHVLDYHDYRTYSALDLLNFHVLLQPTVFLRRKTLDDVGLLNESFDLIMDHEFWIRVASHTRIQHVPEYWAAERSYPEAKTMSSAGLFVEEAERLIDECMSSEAYRAILSGHEMEVRANLAAFSARRMIDAGEYDRSLGFFGKAWNEKPRVVLGYRYKVIQAVLGAFRLEAMFLTYRDFRRKFQHRGKSLQLKLDGYVLQDSQIK